MTRRSHGCTVSAGDRACPDVGAGQSGELIVRGPQVMKGYWKQPEETAKVLRDGWLRTGDIGQVDEDGFFHIIDRKKDMIVVSGMAIAPVAGGTPMKNKTKKLALKKETLRDLDNNQLNHLDGVVGGTTTTTTTTTIITTSIATIADATLEME